MATDNFMKLTVKNQSQIDALKKIGKHDFGVNGGRIVMNGTDLSIFQGDVENFKNSELGNYNAEQLETIFGALDADGNGKLDMKELKSFAALGEDSDNIIDDDKNIIDETDFEALYTMAQDYVEEALVEEPETDSKVDIPTVDDKTKEDEKVSQDENPTDIQDNVITEETEKTVIDDNEAAAAAEELRSAMAGLGTDEKTVTRVLMESGYSSADIVKIMDVFENKYGETLMHDIQGDYSGNAETQLRNLLYNSAAAEVQEKTGWQSTEDIPEDIATKANEFYTKLESGDRKDYMKEFSALSDEEKSQILVACDMLHPDDSAINRLTQGKAWFGKEDDYVDDIISALKNTAGVKESTNEKTPTQDNGTSEERATISNNDAAAKAAELRNAMAGWGTDEKTVTRVLMESGYSSADIVKIMDSFESTYGESLMSDIQGDYSGNAETQLRNLLYNSAAAEAQTTLNWQSTNDIPQEIANQANELYSRLESGGEKSYMKEFSKLSNEEQAKIMLACDLLHPNESVMDRLTQGKVWFGKEDGYVDNIIKGMKKVANTKVS